jgi:Undecaprenyl-phosphate glucose phosphotransferase
MIRRLNLYRFYMRVVCYLLPTLAFAVSRMIHLVGPGPDGYTGETYFALCMALTLIWIICAEYFGVTSVEELFIERTGTWAVLRALTAAYMIAVTLLFLHRDQFLSRAFFATTAVMLFILAVLLRAVFRGIVTHQSRIGRPTRVLIVGADDFARSAAERLVTSPIAACEIAGYVRLRGQTVADGLRAVYDLEGLANLNSRNLANEAVVALSPDQLAQMPHILRHLEVLGIPVRVMLDVGEGVVIRESLFNFNGLQLLDLSLSPSDSLSYLELKRGLDIVFATFVLVIASPLLLLIALGIKLSSPGPVIFKQDRVGLNGRVFEMYKFRTMRVSPAAESDTKWTAENDSRRTAFGALLRKSSLDELPQFANVLLGQMSVVGPRPERPHFVEMFLKEVSRYNSRHLFRVGITGWAQVNGWRGDTSIERRVEYDLYYMQNWSLGFDLRIILMTFLSGLWNKNAY